MTAQSSEDQSPSPNAEGVSAGKSARDEIQQPPTQGEIEGLVAEITERGKVSLWADADLYRRAADRILALQAQVQRGEEERDQARKHLNSEYHARKAAEARLASLREEAVGMLGAALAKVNQAGKACPINAGRACPDRCPKCGARDDQNCGPNVTALGALESTVTALLSRLTQETRQTEGTTDA